MGLRVSLGILLALALAAPALAVCPEEQQLSGQISDSGQQTYTVYLQEAEGGIVDSVRTENGQFSFCLPTDIFPYFVLKIREAPHFYYHILTDFSHSTAVDIQSLHKRSVQLRGTARHQRLIEGRARVQALFGKYLQERRQTPQEEAWTPVQERYDRLLQELLDSFFTEDPVLGAALLSAELTRLEAMHPSWALATRLRAQLDFLRPEMQEAPVVQRIRQTLGQYIYARKGADVLDFTVSGLYGNLLSSRDYRGRYLLLDFWGSWCKPCIEKNEALRLRYDELQAENLVVLTIMMDYARENFDEKFLETALSYDPAYPWPQGILFKDEKSAEIIDYYRAYIIPRSILIDPAGKVIAVDPESPEDILQRLSRRKP